MIFRPRIFISSTFCGNEALREKIREFFISVGAEPLLYEHELTPSTIPMTYRENIKDADFVILIVKDIYGTRTDWDMSGTHEEYLIAHTHNIPTHAYLIKPAPGTPTNPLIDDLIKDRVSYYYFENDDELFKRLQETTFTIAKEIMIAQIVKNNLPAPSIKKLAGNLDYSRSIEIIQIIESMKAAEKKYELDFINTNIFISCLEPINLQIASYLHYFLNWKLDELLKDMLSDAKKFIDNYVYDYTAIPGSSRDYSIAQIGPISISNSSYYQNTELSYEDYQGLLTDFFEKYEKFKNCVQEMRTETDL